MTCKIWTLTSRNTTEQSWFADNLVFHVRAFSIHLTFALWTRWLSFALPRCFCQHRHATLVVSAVPDTAAVLSEKPPLQGKHISWQNLVQENIRGGNRQEDTGQSWEKSGWLCECVPGRQRVWVISSFIYAHYHWDSGVRKLHSFSLWSRFTYLK